MLEATLIHRFISTSWGQKITINLKKYGDWFKSLPLISNVVSEIKKVEPKQIKEKIREIPFNDVIRPTTATSSLTNSSSTYSVIEKKKEIK
jgi:hypothetical protein